MPRAPRRPLRSIAWALTLATAVAAPALTDAAAIDAYYERAVMTAADQRCRLFTPELASALQAAEAQARGAALRSGAGYANIERVERRADAKVATVPCNSPDISLAATRVRAAFDGYSKLVRMVYPGDLSDWTADRSTSRRVPIWKLSQSAQFGGNQMIFGLAGEDGPSSFIVVSSFPRGAQPYAARLVIRNTDLAPEAFINGIGVSGKTPLAARTPPRTATRAFMAEARGDAEPTLLPPAVRSAVAFRFPKAAAQAISALDPREAVAIDFLFVSPNGGEQVLTGYVEVGDFAAGRAFLAASQR